MRDMKTGTQASGLRYVWGIILLFLCLFVALSLFSYDWRDISLLKVPQKYPPFNLIGTVGAWLSFVLFMSFGVGAYLLPIFCIFLGLLLILNKEERIWPKIVWTCVLMLVLINLAELHNGTWDPICQSLNIDDAGGVLGHVITTGMLVTWFSRVGTGILLWGLLVAVVVMFAGVSGFVSAYQLAVSASRLLFDKARSLASEHSQRQLDIEREQREIERRRRLLEKTVSKQEHPEQTASEPPKPARQPEAPAVAVMPDDKVLETAIKPVARKTKPAEAPLNTPAEHAQPYQLPPIDLLDPIPPPKNRSIKTDVATAGKVLAETLAEFGIEAEVVNIVEGPVVTRYELLPAPGVRVERISGLSNNLALSLKATSVRVQAPIPGKGVVGIEVPNATTTIVCLREIMEGETWKSGKAKVPLALGKDVGGHDMVADLTTMPHLLVAGATGSGKTVCMNSILAGFLMARNPEDLKLLLVDPKIVEFSIFNDLPHLVVPVVTNPRKVAIALRWAITEMENRYKLFAKVGVRNIESYNTREIIKQQDLFGELPEGIKKEEEHPQKLPYIVIVIDELADLMLVDQSEIENCIARLAQLSRAVGIHMILSTQRPSVKVITGTIKANFPARIAFQLPQQVDSRTILDTVGAEKLLGRGDMLFLPPGTSKLLRAQGAMTKDDEIKRIVEFIKKQSAPAYEMEIHEKLEKTVSKIDDSDDDEELLAQAVNIIKETHRASTSSLQRRLRIGYTRAARIMDVLEERGVVGPPRGSDAREIMVDLDADMADNAPDTPEQRQEEKTED